MRHLRNLSMRQILGSEPGVIPWITIRSPMTNLFYNLFTFWVCNKCHEIINKNGRCFASVLVQEYSVVEWAKPVSRPPISGKISITKVLLSLVGFDTSREKHAPLLNQPVAFEIRTDNLLLSNIANLRWLVWFLWKPSTVSTAKAERPFCVPSIR